MIRKAFLLGRAFYY